MVEEFKSHELKLIKFKHIKIPVLNWSNRLMNKPDMSNKIVKILMTGVVEVSGKGGKNVKKEFIMCLNLEKRKIEKIKILNNDVKITCINYGPYDNGHVMLGLSDGVLLTFEF